MAQALDFKFRLPSWTLAGAAHVRQAIKGFVTGIRDLLHNTDSDRMKLMGYAPDLIVRRKVGLMPTG